MDNMTDNRKPTSAIFYSEKDKQKAKELSEKLLPVLNGYTRKQVEDAFSCTLQQLDSNHIIKT